MASVGQTSGGQIFTPAWAVKECLNMLPAKVWGDKNYCFYEPSAGKGAFLKEIRERVKWDSSRWRFVEKDAALFRGLDVFDNYNNSFFGDCLDDVGMREWAGKRNVVVVGNPPYMAPAASGAYQRPLYMEHLFYLLNDTRVSHLVFIIPAKWFGESPITDRYRKLFQAYPPELIRFFKDSKKVFPDAFIKGGVCFLYWRRDYRGDGVIDDGECQVSFKQRYDITITNAHAMNIVNKVFKKTELKYSFLKPFYRGWYGDTALFKRRAKETLDPNIPQIICHDGMLGAIKVYKDDVSLRGEGSVDRYKVCARSLHFIPTDARIKIIKNGEIVSDSYMTLKTFKYFCDAKDFKNYMMHPINQFLYFIRNYSSTCNQSFKWIPVIPKKDYKSLWDFYEITRFERDFIEKFNSAERHVRV